MGAAVPSRAPSYSQFERLSPAAASRTGSWTSLADPLHLFLQRFESTPRRRAARYDVGLVGKCGARRALGRRSTHRGIYAQRMADPVLRHLNPAEIRVSIEANSEEVVHLALGPVGRLPHVRDRREGLTFLDAAENPHARGRTDLCDRGHLCSERKQMVHHVKTRRTAQV